MSLANGARLGPYEVLTPLGHGGMGEVYLARHLKLERHVAIKVLPDEVASDRERLSRFEREARLASSLNHPNIITIYDIAEQDGTTFIAMELIDGRTLRHVIADGPIPIERATELALQIAEGLSRAHAAGIVHRDLKPENLMVTTDGLVKILDFGLAKELPRAFASSPDASTMVKTAAQGMVAGTPRYMSPEQVGGGEVDHRSDQFAFGIVLYEMLAGRPPFDGPSLASIITAISHDPPPPLKSIRRDVPPALAKVIRRCLEKNPNDRYASTGDVCRALGKVKQARARKPLMRVLAAAAGAAIVISGLLTWMWFRGAERRWAEGRAVPEITALIEKGDVFEAYRLAIRAQRFMPKNPELAKLLGRISLPRKFVTDPPGAQVSIKRYDTPDAPWEPLGITPFETRTPYALARMRVAKDGYETIEGAPFGAGIMATFARGVKLEPAGSQPPGMVRVLANRYAGRPQPLPLPGGAASIDIDAFWIDRTEVTNRQYKAFVDAGGYRDRKYWVDGFPNEEAPARWNDAITTLNDTTGRSGPSTWSVGTYPEGAENFPVGGVSWYEAAAYCRYAGMTLPTIYHWSSAIGQEQFSDILRLSNFSGEGPAPVGKYQGVAGYGALDMAGNLKEWCLNATPTGERHILGGAWNEPAYVFMQVNARNPAERLPTYGFRCAKYAKAPGPALLAPADTFVKVLTLPSVSDEVFEAYRAMYAYDASPLDATIDRTDDSSPYWKKQIVSFDAAYDNDRVIAILFLPRNAKPPYQTVIWFAGTDAFAFRSSETLAGSYLFDFIPRSGRALVYLIYEGIYERAKVRSGGVLENRDQVIRWSKDFSRTVDYLQTRGDIDRERLAYYGLSSGASYGPIFTAVDGRIRTSILLGGGLMGRAKRLETAPATFAPRCRIPTILINGTDDFMLPYEAQKALLDRLGTPPGDKRHVRLEGGHIPSNRVDIIHEVLDWLDKYLGPVQTGTAKQIASVR